MEAKTLTLAAPKLCNQEPQFARSKSLFFSLGSNCRPPFARPPRRCHGTEKEKALRREIGDLKTEVVREHLKSKRIRLCGLMELFLEVAVLFVLCGFLFTINKWAVS